MDLLERLLGIPSRILTSLSLLFFLGFFFGFLVGGWVFWFAFVWVPPSEVFPTFRCPFKVQYGGPTSLIMAPSPPPADLSPNRSFFPFLRTANTPLFPYGNLSQFLDTIPSLDVLRRFSPHTSRNV